MTIYEVEDVQSFLKINGHWCDYCTGSQLRLGKESHKHFVERKNKKLKTIHTDQSELIEYRFNDFGYRSDNNYNDLLFSTKDYILGIGDSNTEGLGVKNEDTWLEKLGRMIGIRTVNFGLTSGTVDYCNYQLLQLYLKKDKINFPRYVFVLTPPTNRFSIINRDKMSFFQDWNFINEDINEQGTLLYNGHPIIDRLEENQFNRFEKNYENQVYILNLLKEKHNFFKLDWDEFGLDFPLSVDGLHFDETYHEKIAKEFYKKKVN